MDYCFDFLSDLFKFVGLFFRFLLFGKIGQLVKSPYMFYLHVFGPDGPSPIFLFLQLLAHEGAAHLILIPKITVQTVVFNIKVDGCLACQLTLNESLVD